MKSIQGKSTTLPQLLQDPRPEHKPRRRVSTPHPTWGQHAAHPSPGAGTQRSIRGSGASSAAAPGDGGRRRPSRWLRTPPLPPAAPCRATMNLSGRAIVTEHRCRPGSRRPRPASPGRAPAAGCESPAEPFLGASCCSEGRSPGFPHTRFPFFPPTFFSCSCNHCFRRSAGFLSRSCRVLVFLLASGLLGDLVVSPWSRASARRPMGPQNTTDRNYSLPAPQYELTPNCLHFEGDSWSPAHTQSHCTVVASTKRFLFHLKVQQSPPAEFPTAPGSPVSLPHHCSPAEPFPCSLPAIPITPPSSFAFCFHSWLPPSFSGSGHGQRSGMSLLADLPLHLSHSLHFHRSLPSSSCPIHPQSSPASLAVPQPARPE